MTVKHIHIYRSLEFANGYKASRRRDDDIAIVTCGMRLALGVCVRGESDF